MFGLLKPTGKIELKLDKLNYSFGEAIKGTVKLEIFSPKSAKALRITLFATKKKSERRHDGTHSTRDVIIYSFTADLDNEHEYSGTKEYPFELRLPPKESETKLPDGTLGQLAGIAIAASQAMGALNPPRWIVKANLDIPNAFDLAKEIQISVS